MACRSCGQRIIERGASPYMGKVAHLHNGESYTITDTDPANPRMFGAKKEDGTIMWFTLSDIRALKG
jgi:hypothetical protein